MLAPGLAQDAPKPTTFLGTVQTLSGNSLTVKNDAGATMQVTVQDGARLLRIEPGQKTLSNASPFSLTDLSTGDRVMARGSANPDGSLAAFANAQQGQEQRDYCADRSTALLLG